jgi:spore coat polysaccharide biosynthesis protein SpsF
MSSQTFKNSQWHNHKNIWTDYDISLQSTVKIGAIIEARMESTRLPGKVLLKSNGIAMLERLINRLKQCEEISEIIIATTSNATDDEICELALNLGVNFFRGSEADVLSRVLSTAQKYEIDTIVEITGDCPIIDVGVVGQVIKKYLESRVDYVSNSNVRSYPDGMDVQVYSTATLEKSARMVSTDLEREHVTLHIRRNPQIFSRIDIIAPEEFFLPHLGLTLDTKEDFELIDKIISELEGENQFFSLRDILRFLEANPKLFELNRDVSRKGDS